MAKPHSIKGLPKAIAIIGPTAVGKTELSLRIAERFSGEIISVDSMQVYRFMDIGTAKASLEERQRVPHHLIDIINPDEEYNVSRFIDDALRAGEIIRNNRNFSFLVGGTGLYLKGLTDGVFEMEPIDPAIRRKIHKRLKEEGQEVLYKELTEHDPASADKIHPNDTHRTLRALEVYESSGLSWSEHLTRYEKKPSMHVLLKIGLMCDRDLLYQRINARTEEMLQCGLLDEVKNLLDMGYDCTLNSMQSIGYRHMCNYIEGKWSLDKTKELLARDTRHYAKRQLTWFKKDQEIQWSSPDNESKIMALISKALNQMQKM